MSAAPIVSRRRCRIVRPMPCAVRHGPEGSRCPRVPSPVRGGTMSYHRATIALATIAVLAGCAADRATAPRDLPVQLDVKAPDVIGGGRAGGHAEFTVSDIKSM